MAPEPDLEAAFRAWWTAFLADWQQRYPHTAPPDEAAGRACFYEVKEARERYTAPKSNPAERWERVGHHPEPQPRVSRE